MEEKKRLGRAIASQQPIMNIGNTSLKPGYVVENQYKFDYRQVIKDSRHFYQNDPISGTVINRLCEIGITALRNKRKNKNANKAVSDEIIAYYNHVSEQLKPFLKQLALEFLIHGMVIPEFTTIRRMGSRATDKLGRTRYIFPEHLWCRNVDNIELVKLPSGVNRLIFLKISSEEIRLIKEKGGKDLAKIALYEYYLKNYPEYVEAVRKGQTKFQLTNVIPLYRKLTSYNDYPLPYLTNAIDPMKHKAHLKNMDRSIAARVIEAVRQIKVGNDEYPADDEDLKAEQQAFIAYGNTGEKVFNYFTNHTISIEWSYPPFESLLSETKYSEPNREIFFALGFPRIWTNGETEKSNAADNALAAVGPISTINEIRDQVLTWVKAFYERLAELNNFDRIPEPYFSAINLSDVANLIQYADAFYQSGAISLDTMASLYNTDYETEVEQRKYEQETEKELNLEPESNNANPEAAQEFESQNPATNENGGSGAGVSNQDTENT